MILAMEVDLLANQNPKSFLTHILERKVEGENATESPSGLLMRADMRKKLSWSEFVQSMGMRLP